ncbi:MAG: c-type cytochrome [Gemmatimonadaceae bacterium]|nr:c-type cytochrome [Gemmatimonadaceae bacterium]
MPLLIKTSTARVAFTLTLVLHLIACAGDPVAASDADDESPPPTNLPSNTEAVAVLIPNSAQAAMVGVPFRYDASRGGSVFSDPRRTGLTYTVTFAGGAAGLSATGCEIMGVPNTPGVQRVTITARDTTGRMASQQFTIVVFSDDLTVPVLPATPAAYSDARVPIPRHVAAPGNGALALDNTPNANPTTDAGATLGRVLFYDRRLSANDRVACASCHQQQFAFSDTARLSRGFMGGRAARHSMGLANARFYANGRFFWDERAVTLEAQVLQPIQDPTEMGLTLDDLVTKVSLTSHYPQLFEAAFGSREITTERISRALAQFVRALNSWNSTLDRAFDGNGTPDFTRLPVDVQQGQALFTGRAGCARCHSTVLQIGDQARNTGLDATITDVGAGNGTFKAPSLRNVAVRAPYMHDGRFLTLEAVVDFYDRGVQANPQLDQRLRVPPPAGQQPNPNLPPLRLNLTQGERASLLAFLRSLTDSTFLIDARFASPFR